MSEKLVEHYRNLHKNELYGNTSVKNLPYLAGLISELKPATIVDFGCGQSNLYKELTRLTQAQVTRFDPAIAELSTPPVGKFDLLINIDVLEHLPEPELDQIISDMSALSENAIIIIDTGPAVQFLPDGRNAHLTQRPVEWWSDRLQSHYTYLRRIRVRSARRAAFITWPQSQFGLKHAYLFIAEELRYKITRLMRSL